MIGSSEAQASEADAGRILKRLSTTALRVGSLMSARVIGFAILAAIIVGAPATAGVGNRDALRSRFPSGIPWRIEILDKWGERLGVLDVLITSQPAKSCLKDFRTGYVVLYFAHPAVLGSGQLGRYGIASIDGDSISLDLTGGKCGDYVIMKGKVGPDGTSIGEVFTLHRAFGHNLGSYRATLR